MNDAVPRSTSAANEAANFLDRGRDSRPAAAELAAPERRVEDSRSMTRRILLCQEQTPRCKRGRLPSDASLLRYHDAAIGMPDKNNLTLQAVDCGLCERDVLGQGFR